MPKLKKPAKVIPDPYYNFNDVMHYLEKLHGKNFRDYAGKFGKKATTDEDAPYLDFWHWMLDTNEVHNGCWIHFPETALVDSDTPDWVKEILGYFKDFLGDDYYDAMWCDW